MIVAGLVFVFHSSLMLFLRWCAFLCGVFISIYGICGGAPPSVRSYQVEHLERTNALMLLLLYDLPDGVATPALLTQAIKTNPIPPTTALLAASGEVEVGASAERKSQNTTTKSHNGSL